MTLSEELQWRGFINQTTFADMGALDSQQWTFYHGFDASADSQQVGNLAAMMFDKVFIRHGHKAIIVAGGATSLIGDPGGKDEERPLQEAETIARNVTRAEEQLKRIFTGHEFTLVNNLDWTRDLRLIDFLRDIGKHFSMTPLVQRDYIAKRLGEGGSGMSFTEFSYTLLQGMDFLHLYENYNCTLQLGGSDQWGNCLSGVNLIRRKHGVETHVITQPLVINKATGKKFGKSEDGAVWLDAEKTSVYQFYQFWLNADDEGVADYLKIFTELDKDTVDRIIHEFSDDRAHRLAQKTLAFEVTKLVHGQDRAETARRATDVLFGEAGVTALADDVWTVLRGELRAVPTEGDIFDVLVASGLAASKSEARNFVNAGAVSLDGNVLAADAQQPDWQPGPHLLKRGKNSFAIVDVS